MTKSQFAVLTYSGSREKIYAEFLVYHGHTEQHPFCGILSTTKVQHLSFEYFTSRGVTLAGAKAANRV